MMTVKPFLFFRASKIFSKVGLACMVKIKNHHLEIKNLKFTIQDAPNDLRGQHMGENV